MTTLDDLEKPKSILESLPRSKHFIKKPRTYRSRKTGEIVEVKRKQSKWLSPTKKAEAVTAYLSLGNATLVSALIGVNPGTIRSWRTMAWWKELETTIRDEENLMLDVKLSKIVNKTLNLLEDRIDNGDSYFNPKTGRLEKKPLNANVANKVLSDTFDRRQVLRRKNVEENVNSVRPEDFLLRLASEFVKIARGDKTPVIDVEVVKPLEEITYAQETGTSPQEASSQETHEQGKDGSIRVWNSSENRMDSEHPEKGEVSEQSLDSKNRGSGVQDPISSGDQGKVDGGMRSRQESNPDIAGSESGNDTIHFTP